MLYANYGSMIGGAVGALAIKCFVADTQVLKAAPLLEAAASELSLETIVATAIPPEPATQGTRIWRRIPIGPALIIVGLAGAAALTAGPLRPKRRRLLDAEEHISAVDQAFREDAEWLNSLAEDLEWRMGKTPHSPNARPDFRFS